MKYIISDVASTMVVRSGLAIMAGSSLNVFARMGSAPPIIFASIMVKNRVMHTVNDTYKSVCSRKYILMKFNADKTRPQIKLT